MPLDPNCGTTCPPLPNACERIPGMVHGTNCPCTGGEVQADGKVKVSMLEILHGLTYKGINVWKFFPNQRYGDSLAYSFFDVTLDGTPENISMSEVLNKLQLRDMGMDVLHGKDGVTFATMKKQSFHAEVVAPVAAATVIPVDDVSRFAAGYTLIYYGQGAVGAPVTTAYGETFTYLESGDPYLFEADCCLFHDTVLITAVDPIAKTITVDRPVTLGAGARVVLGQPNIDISGINCGEIDFPSNYYEDDVELEKSLWQITAGQFTVTGDHLRDVCEANKEAIYNIALQRFLRLARPMFETIYRGLALAKYISRNIPAANGRGSETMGLDAMVVRGRLNYGLTNDVFIQGVSVQEKAIKFDKYMERATEEVYVSPDGSKSVMMCLCTKQMFGYITNHVLPAIHTLRKASMGCIGTYSCTMAKVVENRMRIYSMDTIYGTVEFFHDPILDELKGPGSKELYHVPRHQIGLVFKKAMRFGEDSSWNRVSLEMPNFNLVDDIDEEKRRKTQNILDCEVTYSLAFAFAIVIVGYELHGVGHVMMA